MSTCRVCGSDGVRLVLDLGEVPLANSLISADDVARDSEPTFPLGMQFCPTCAIAQLPVLVDPEVMFRHYLYTPSASSTWRDHCRELSEWIRTRSGTAALVVEPASNDGCLLREIATWADRVLGVDPARNIAEQANREGIPTICEFFGQTTAKAIASQYGRAHVVVGTNVLAHVPDIVDFLRGVEDLLDDDGWMVVEAPYLRDLAESVAYDTIYHEHVSYLSVTALSRILPLAGLRLIHVERTPTHGGSIRFVGARPHVPADESVATFLSDEDRLGYASGEALLGFAAAVDTLRTQLEAILRSEVARGAAIAGYGATAKGNTLLTTCDIPAGWIRYIVDRNPLKQGLFAPGSHIPIVAPEMLEADPVDVLLVLAWNIAPEVMEQQRDFAERGGRFLIPVPVPRLVS